MFFSLLAIVVALACVAASVRRLRFAAEASALDARVLLAALRGDRDVARATWSAIKGEIAREPRAEWERDLIEALGAQGPARVALVNEQLGELDYRAQRWARVPRVCASISTSFGFLLASLALRDALAAESIDPNEAVIAAINVAAVGLAGAVACIAVQARARHLTKEALAATDKLVDRVEQL